MSFLSVFGNALRALAQNVRRTVLTMLGIVIGISSVIMILAIGQGFQGYVVRNLTQSATSAVKVQLSFQPTSVNAATGQIAYFNQNDLALLKSLQGVANAVFSSTDQDSLYQNLTLSGTSYSEYIQLVGQGTPVTMGRSISGADISQRYRVAVIDGTTAAKIVGEHGDIAKALGYGISLDDELYQVVGIAGGKAGYMQEQGINIEIPKTTFQFYNPQSMTPQMTTITIRQGSQPTRVTNDAIGLLTQQGSMRDYGTYSSFDLSSLTDGIGKVLSYLTLFISSVAGISLLIAGVGVMNMMYTAVAERTKEIGIRRSCGARRRDIRNQFLAEGLLLTVSSGIIGYVIGFLVAWLISQFLPFRVSPDWFTVAIALGTTTLIGLFFSITPANQAARKDLAEILR